MRARKLGRRVVRFVAVAALVAGGALVASTAVNADEVEEPVTVDQTAPSGDSESGASPEEWKWE